ncbi:hypothetical protein G6F65_020195 [Rhizopus arrhizus]|nr:hypothetical protein G6F65_020195 [Rhizopus arrhizus]
MPNKPSAAKGAAADVQAHDEAQRVRFDLFGQIGHRHRGHAAHRHALQGAQRQQAVPIRCHRRERAQHGRRNQGQRHHPLARQRLREQPHKENRHSQEPRAQRQDQAALRG